MLAIHLANIDFIQHYMLKPVQRLPQYRLLLEDYLKHLDPDGDDFDDTTAALRIVSEVAEQADNTIKQGVRRHFQMQARVFHPRFHSFFPGCLQKFCMILKVAKINP